MNNEPPERVWLYTVRESAWTLSHRAAPGNIEYLRADLANREPSEVDVERVMRAIYGPDLDSEPAYSGIEHGIFRRAALRAINAWRNP